MNFCRGCHTQTFCTCTPTTLSLPSAYYLKGLLRIALALKFKPRKEARSFIRGNRGWFCSENWKRNCTDELAISIEKHRSNWFRRDARCTGNDAFVSLLSVIQVKQYKNWIFHVFWKFPGKFHGKLGIFHWCEFFMEIWNYSLCSSVWAIIFERVGL